MFNFKVQMSQLRFYFLLNLLLAKYRLEFMAPSWNALRSFIYAESLKSLVGMQDLVGLSRLNQSLLEKSMEASLKAMTEFFQDLTEKSKSLSIDEAEAFWDKQVSVLEALLYHYSDAIWAIGAEYGFHFDDGGYEEIGEASTARFDVYLVKPTNGVETDMNAKPVLIFPPIVLGANILAFLVKEGMSYVHKFANEGVPTYVRVPKDIRTTLAVQVMTGEDDALDTKHICKVLFKRHGKLVTLNGVCQGGFMALADLLTGELDGLADALITCVTPADGSRGGTIIDYMKDLGPRYIDLNHSIKFLPNGNPVVDGHILSWVYKLRSISRDWADVTLFGNIRMVQKLKDPCQFSKKALAVNHWMVHDRIDYPPEIVKLSFATYVKGIAKDGTLPFKLFGRTLNVKRLQELGIKCMICIAEKDDLVPKAAAVALLDFIEAELSIFEKGHIDMLISPEFKPADIFYRTPVQFHRTLKSKVEIAASDYGDIPELTERITSHVA